MPRRQVASYFGLGWRRQLQGHEQEEQEHEEGQEARAGAGHRWHNRPQPLMRRATRGQSPRTVRLQRHSLAAGVRGPGGGGI